MAKNLTLLLGVVIMAVGGLQAQTFTVLHHFTNSPDGATPWAGVTVASNVVYGTTGGGGSLGGGTVFKVNTDGTGYAILNNFSSPVNGTNSDGADPGAELALSGSTLYGTTWSGGNAGNGTIFKISTDGTSFAMLKSFDNPNDGITPWGLTLSGSALYGMATGGGSSEYGTIFKINTNGTGFTVLHDFTNSPDGAYPWAGLTASDNLLYGMTPQGGDSGYGTLFRINTDGTGFVVLKNFDPVMNDTNTVGTNNSGAFPLGGVALSGNVLFGTTFYGGAGYGTVFRVNADGTDFKVLKTFYVPQVNEFGNPTNRDGAEPKAGLVVSGNVLYGATEYGGSSGNGTVFQVNMDGSGFTVLKNFSALSINLATGVATNSDGANPFTAYAGLALSGGVLYGTASGGGNFSYGTVFALTPPPPPLNIVTTDGLFGFTNGEFHFTLTGPAGSNAVIYTSSNLQNWIPLATNSLTDGPLNFTDSLATNFPSRFYRARLVP